MKMKKMLIAFGMVAVIGAGATAYAESNTNTVNHGLGLGRVTSMRGYDYVSSVLKDKLGMTDKEITDGLNSGKTMYDLAKDKGMSSDDFKKALIEKKSKAVDEAVSKGIITKDEGESLKANINTNISNCDGTGSNGRREKGQGLRKNGHRGNYHTNTQNSSL